MTPIHHSKLKKGDLIYVESMMLDLDGSKPLWSYLAEVIDTHSAFYYIKTNDTVFMASGTLDYIFLIERGYFL